ncbi:hypothetical protein NDY24_04195 [Xanthomonas hortorum pv. pelargonii]|nr:hypothetical protein NDY24_04195 [Xanthomonas hortorum pv. pelargonii]
MATKKTENPGKSIEQITHTEAKRKNIPTVEHQSVMQHHEQAPVQVAYPRANRQWLGELCALHDGERFPRNSSSSLTATSIHNSFGEARISKTGQIWSSMRRRCTSKRR